jgi:hypothetical protein
VGFRLIRGELKAGTIAPGVDDVERFWQLHKVAHYPVYVIYGLDVVLIRASKLLMLPAMSFEEAKQQFKQRYLEMKAHCVRPFA